MIWHRRSLSAPPPLVGFLEERLVTAGYERISSEREPGAPRATLRVYAEEEADLPDSEVLARWLAEADAAGLPAAALRWETDELGEEDWNAAFRAHFTDRQLGERLRLLPSWDCPSGRPRQRPPGPGAKLEIYLEPGQAFGTGDHPTTIACLQRLEGWMLRHGGAAPRCLDVGSGTGVLAIAARLWGAGAVVGFDIDGNSIVNSYLNAELNGLAGELEFRWGEPENLAPAAWDLVLCNLFLGPILRLLPRLDLALAPGGGAILSGFLSGQAPRMREAATARGWCLSAEEDHEDWMVQEWRRPV